MNDENSNETFSNNDGSKRAVGFRKQIRRDKPPISLWSNGVEAMAKQNEVFEDLDGIQAKDHKVLVRLLKLWHELYTHREKEEELSVRQSKLG